MLILIACECSGKVRDAFLKKGHEVYSCDIKPCSRPGPHFQQSVTDLLPYRWDMLIGFPPCTYLTTAGARWWGKHPDHTPQAQQAGFDFFMLLFRQKHIPKIALENPARGKLNDWFRPPTQIIQPYEHGENVTKATGLWLKNLPRLQPSQPVEVETKNISWARDCEQDQHMRSITFNGIARAMANQWT